MEAQGSSRALVSLREEHIWVPPAWLTDGTNAGPTAGEGHSGLQQSDTSLAGKGELGATSVFSSVQRPGYKAMYKTKIDLNMKSKQRCYKNVITCT